MNTIRVDVDPEKHRIVRNTATGEPVCEHFLWCMNNCKSHWYNECNDYSYIRITDEKEAATFRLRFGKFESEKEKIWFTLRWS